MESVVKTTGAVFFTPERFNHRRYSLVAVEHHKEIRWRRRVLYMLFNTTQFQLYIAKVCLPHMPQEISQFVFSEYI